MELWKGKVAVVTGSSAGIGTAICRDLCQSGLIVVGLARRLDRLQELKSEIEKETPGSVFVPLKCDVTKESDIVSAFDSVNSSLGGVDVLVNNAGILLDGMIFDEGDNFEGFRRTIDTNLVGVISCTKKAISSMLSRDVPGYIINISSVAGHSVPNSPGVKPFLNVYPATKYALRALGVVMRHELNYLKRNKVRMSTISPGAVDTDIFAAGCVDLSGWGQVPFLQSRDVSNVVLYLLGTDPRVQIEDVVIRPTGEAF